MAKLIQMICCVCVAKMGFALKGTNSAVCCYACKRKRDLKARKVQPNKKPSKKPTTKKRKR